MQAHLLTVVLAWLMAATATVPQQREPAPSPGARALREVCDFLLGSWELEAGPAGSVRGSFSFEMDLAGHAALHRIQIGGAPVPGSDGRGNELLLVLYPEAGRIRALYLDNDGRVVRFEVGYAHDTATLTFTSEPAAGQPRQRLSYRPLGRDRVEVVSEASATDGRGPMAVTSRSTWRRTK